MLGMAGARVVDGELPVSLAHEKFEPRASSSTRCSRSVCARTSTALVAEASAVLLAAA